jgi:hypothetical protein
MQSGYKDIISYVEQAFNGLEALQKVKRPIVKVIVMVSYLWMHLCQYLMDTKQLMK